MFWNSRYQNTMSAAYAEAFSVRASTSANTALTVDAILPASILVILGRLLSLSGIIVSVVILAVQGIGKGIRRGIRWGA